MLIDLLGRRAVHVVDDRERAELFREMAVIYERELSDDSGALDAYRDADRLAPDHPDVLEALGVVIDLGPEGGEAGGEVVATGTPEEVAAVATSHTGGFLAGLVEAPAPSPRTSTTASTASCAMRR